MIEFPHLKRCLLESAILSVYTFQSWKSLLKSRNTKTKSSSTKQFIIYLCIDVQVLGVRFLTTTHFAPKQDVPQVGHEQKMG